MSGAGLYTASSAAAASARQPAFLRASAVSIDTADHDLERRRKQRIQNEDEDEEEEDLFCIFLLISSCSVLFQQIPMKKKSISWPMFAFCARGGLRAAGRRSDISVSLMKNSMKVCIERAAVTSTNASRSRSVAHPLIFVSDLVMERKTRRRSESINQCVVRTEHDVKQCQRPGLLSIQFNVSSPGRMNEYSEPLPARRDLLSIRFHPKV